VLSRRFNRRGVVIAVALVFIALLAGIASLINARKSPAIPQVAFSDLLRHLDGGAVSAVVVNGDVIDFTLADGHTFRAIAPAN
jgi:hypothetical protein